MKPGSGENTPPRLFARRLARELTAEEVEAVAGGNETGASFAGGYCFVCTMSAGHDIETYERD